ncbi:uncharacterized protein ACLA_060530 [Aspergillus clavatus NRRL 1]|uniref:DAGKc domain-containing protein n=1 Tax=Aspergillus clavatus (strain ATCC 1007 / CBS 513.65 / DSM 816 / NCTC 3887 / NRRL 1 / QM 1276 / 107) TaxID=344612 RepID=A1CC41_ASPCL|nr:uncharacterized protein ACLA_060530 [Aspergillus clavatus NRRL 1]EAW12098.1 conserved hypothetical protein [Aspergillus clavatus NRRL 1]
MEMAQPVNIISGTSPLFWCHVIGDSIQCSGAQGQNVLRIAMDDVICILPHLSQDKSQYTMIYLRHNTWEAISQLEENTPARLVASILLTSPPSILLSRYLCAELPPHLRSTGSQKLDIHVIISSLSGTGKARRFFSKILQPLLSDIGLTEYEVHQTQSARSILDLCRTKLIVRANLRISQTIILLSGDGGLTDIVGSFHDATNNALVPPSIALIPLGTGNAMASSLNLLSNPAASLTTLVLGRPHPVPTFVTDFSPGVQYLEEGHVRVSVHNPSMNESTGHLRYGAVVASWGVHASLVADSDTPEYRKFGAERFQMAAKELLFPSNGTATHSYHGKLTLLQRNTDPDETKRKTVECEKHMYMLAALVPRLERDFVISPESVPLDGCLRMVHFGPIPPEQAMQLMASAYQGGGHVHEREVFYSEMDGFRIDLLEADERWRRICIDGRIFVIEEGGWVEVRKESRRLVGLLVRSMDDME